MNTAKAGVQMEMEEGLKGDDFNHDNDHDSESGTPETILLPEKDDDESTQYSSKDGLEYPQNAADRTPKVRGWIWMALSCSATLNGRLVLKTGFPFPLYFTFLTQLGAYLTVTITVLIIQLAKCLSTERKKEDVMEGRNSAFEQLVIVSRTLGAHFLEGIAILYAAEAVLHFPSLPLLVMLPILTYAFDSLLFRLAYCMRILPQDQEPSIRRIHVVFVVLWCISLAIYDDYRLNVQGLGFALAGFFFSSLAKVVAKIGPRIERKGTQNWRTALHTYLWAAIPPLVLAGFAAVKFENHVGAYEVAKSWGFMSRFWIFGPGILLHVLFKSPMNAAYPFISRQHIVGALEEDSAAARDATATTLQAGFWILVLGVFGKETTFVGWLQAISFTVIYIVSVDPKQIGYYPPRFFNLIRRLFRHRPVSIHHEPWQEPLFLTYVTTVFAFLVICNVMFWVNTIAFDHSLRQWNNPIEINTDTVYRPPKIRGIEFVIAHSEDEPLDFITSLISKFAHKERFEGAEPIKVTIYTKSSNVTDTYAAGGQIKKDSGLDWKVDVKMMKLANVGGVSATYLHHILSQWDQLTVHTIFLDAATRTSLEALESRWDNFYIAPGHPIPDALPKTGFLNLGEVESCECDRCFGEDGWEDSFHLVTSMYGASHQQLGEGEKITQELCKKVVLTKGNNFIVSAARIRGTNKDVWTMLYDALVNEDVGNAWAHDKKKLPQIAKGEEGRGRSAEGEVYGLRDSVERPWLGMTVERLWGTMMQCGSGGDEWICEVGNMPWASFGKETNCGCID